GVTTETAWAHSGGGVSTVEPRPAYQQGFASASTNTRSSPDVAFSASSVQGVSVYDTYDGTSTPSSTPWWVLGGTSFSAPAWSALIAIADQGRALISQPTLDGPTQTLPDIYSLPTSDFHDIVEGNNGFAAGPGYDLVTGRGTPDARR